MNKHTTSSAQLSHRSTRKFRASAFCFLCNKPLSVSVDLSVFITLSVLFFPGKAWAYLDPGTGSMILQGLIAGLMGALFTIKIYWARIKNFFSRSKSGKEDDLKRDG